jgi:hypothetical protein
MAWGRRRAAPGEPAPPLPIPDTYLPLHLRSASDSEIGTSTAATPASTGLAVGKEVHQVELYTSQEESLERARKRASTVGQLPQPLVSAS